MSLLFGGNMDCIFCNKEMGFGETDFYEDGLENKTDYICENCGATVKIFESWTEPDNSVVQMFKE